MYKYHIVTNGIYMALNYRRLCGCYLSLASRRSYNEVPVREGVIYMPFVDIYEFLLALDEFIGCYLALDEFLLAWLGLSMATTHGFI